MRQGDGVSAETVAALITAVVVVPLAVIAFVLVSRICRRRQRQKQQQQQLRLQQTQMQHQSAAPPHDTAARFVTGSSAAQRPREW